MLSLTASIYQCVPNFSEGRRLEVVAALADAVAGIPGIRLIDRSADFDHNRCVLTLLGDAEPIHTALMAMARIAIAQIDLRAHTGVHPRVGALDVLPIVPLRNAGREEAIEAAHRLGTDLAAEFDLPIYYYEWAAYPGRPSALPELRRGGMEAIMNRPLVGKFAPDAGPPFAHPTAGITLVGARGPLVAYNCNLAASEVRIAQEIARRIRAERDRIPELEGVRALGRKLASRGMVQVSMNLTRPERTPLPAVLGYVRAEAQACGTDVAESEIIGAIPLASLGGQSPEALLWHNYHPNQILETWLQP